jgi:hypothetical protein
MNDGPNDGDYGSDGDGDGREERKLTASGLFPP